MFVTREELGSRLRARRELLGYTQKQVAEELGLHRPTISEIEAGRRDVTSEELFALARLYVTSLSDILAEPVPSENQVTQVLFRMPGLETPEARKSVERFMEQCRDEKELEDLLGIEGPGPYRRSVQLPDPANKWEAVQQGERIAAQERIHLELGSLPIRNPLDLLEAQGVRIGPLNGEDGADVDGVYFESETLGACIGVNSRPKDHTGFRAAFTAAHEYAHWLLRDIRVEEFTFGQGSTDDLREVRANSFAAAFLMPKDGLETYMAKMGLLRDSLVTHMGLADMVRAMDFFGVSKPALLYRLQNVELMEADVAGKLRGEQVPASQLRAVAEKLGLDLRRSDYVSVRLHALALEAWRRGLLGAGRAAELVGVTIEGFREFASDIGVSQEYSQGDTLLGAALGAG